MSDALNHTIPPLAIGRYQVTDCLVAAWASFTGPRPSLERFVAVKLMRSG